MLFEVSRQSENPDPDSSRAGNIHNFVEGTNAAPFRNAEEQEMVKHIFNEGPNLPLQEQALKLMKEGFKTIGASQREYFAGKPNGLLPDITLTDAPSKTTDSVGSGGDSTDSIEKTERSDVRRTLNFASKALGDAVSESDQLEVYEELNKRIEIEVADMNPEAKKEFLDLVVKGLEEEGQIPELSMIYAKSEYGNLAKNFKISGITLGDLDNREKSGNPDALEKAFIDYLRQEHDTLADKHDNLFWDRDISEEDIDEGLTEFKESRANGLESFKIADRLLDDDGKLFDFIESLSDFPGEGPDIKPIIGLLPEGEFERPEGGISKADLQKYLELAEQLEDPMFSSGNKELVEKLVESWDEPLGERLRGPNGFGSLVKQQYQGFISRESLARAAGFNDVETLEKQVENVVLFESNQWQEPAGGDHPEIERHPIVIRAKEQGHGDEVPRQADQGERQPYKIPDDPDTTDKQEGDQAEKGKLLEHLENNGDVEKLNS